MGDIVASARCRAGTAHPDLPPASTVVDGRRFVVAVAARRTGNPEPVPQSPTAHIWHYVNGSTITLDAPERGTYEFLLTLSDAEGNRDRASQVVHFGVSP